MQYLHGHRHSTVEETVAPSPFVTADRSLNCLKSGELVYGSCHADDLPDTRTLPFNERRCVTPLKANLLFRNVLD